MKRLLVSVYLLAPGVGHAQEQSVQSRLESALGFEWFIANCEQGQHVPFLQMTTAAMTINGHTVTDVASSRKLVQDRIRTMWPNPTDACVAFAKVQEGNQ